MSGYRRALSLLGLVASTGCAASTDEAPCDGAIAQQLEVAYAAAASVHELAHELSTTLFGSCLALLHARTVDQSTTPPDVDTMVAVCADAAHSLADFRESGATVTGTKAQCDAPAPDADCLQRCSNDAGCTSLCNSIATFQVQCSGATVRVRGGEQNDYETLLPPVLLSYARSHAVTDASSSYVDVALPLLTDHEECVGPLAPEYWDDVIMLQAVLVMSSDIAEQVTGFPL